MGWARNVLFSVCHSSHPKLKHMELWANLQEHFYDQSRSNKVPPRFHNKSSWSPPHNREIALEAFNKVAEEHIKYITPYKVGWKLTLQEKEALHNLVSHSDIIIKPADKRTATVLVDREWYLNECYHQLVRRQDHGQLTTRWLYRQENAWISHY